MKKKYAVWNTNFSKAPGQRNHATKYVALNRCLHILLTLSIFVEIFVDC